MSVVCGNVAACIQLHLSLCLCISQVIHGNAGKSNDLRFSWVAAHLVEYVRTNGDEQQHGAIFLARFLEFRDMWECLHLAWRTEQQPGPPPTLAFLRHVWRKDKWFRLVKQPRNADFGHCSECVRLSQEREAGFANDNAVSSFRNRQELHTALHVTARRMMAEFVAEAKQQPGAVTFLTFDLTRSMYVPQFATTTRVSHHRVRCALPLQAC